jgi:hypothetical protein
MEMLLGPPPEFTTRTVCSVCGVTDGVCDDDAQAERRTTEMAARRRIVAPGE